MIRFGFIANSTDYPATIVDVQCVPLGTDPTGQLSSAYLILRFKVILIQSPYTVPELGNIDRLWTYTWTLN